MTFQHLRISTESIGKHRRENIGSLDGRLHRKEHLNRVLKERWQNDSPQTITSPLMRCLVASGIMKSIGQESHPWQEDLILTHTVVVKIRNNANYLAQYLKQNRWSVKGSYHSYYQPHLLNYMYCYLLVRPLNVQCAFFFIAYIMAIIKYRCMRLISAFSTIL